MNEEEEKEYQERIGSPEMEFLQHQTDFPYTPTADWAVRFDEEFIIAFGGKGSPDDIKTFIAATLKKEKVALLREVVEEVKDTGHNASPSYKEACEDIARILKARIDAIEK